ncbi:hypothetical protein HK102_001271 [Quaeritorhiza haematococci]|nr:hypothetical protein HK102_001271 [Quaeritorhiza haematococci]
MRSYIAFTLASLAAFASSTYALPGGAPRCAVNETAIANAHGSPSNPALGYGIQVSGPVTPGQPVDITVTNSAGRDSFNGILIYVVGSNPQLRLGQFLNIDAASFKPQTEICQTAQFTGDASAVLTHSNPSPKPLTTRLQWQMLPQDAAADPGPYQIVSAIVISPAEWMVVPPVPLQVAGGAPAGAPAAPQPPAPVAVPGAPPVGGRRILKCRPKNMPAGQAAAMPMPAPPMPAAMPAAAHTTMAMAAHTTGMAMACPPGQPC